MGVLEGTARAKSTRVSQSQGLSRLMCRKSAGMLRGITRRRRNAWLLATNQDLRFPGVRLKGARPNPGLRLLYRYMDLVLYSAIVDPEIAQAYFKVLMLATTPRSLVQPHMVARVLAVAGKRAVERLLGGEEEPSFALSSEALVALHAQPPMYDAKVSLYTETNPA